MSINLVAHANYNKYFIFNFIVTNINNLFKIIFCLLLGINPLDTDFSLFLGYNLDANEEVITESQLKQNGYYTCLNCPRRLLFVICGPYPYIYFSLVKCKFKISIFRYQNLASLKRHLQHEHDDPKFECKKCEAKFRYNFKLSKHIEKFHKGVG